MTEYFGFTHLFVSGVHTQKANPREVPNAMPPNKKNNINIITRRILANFSILYCVCQSSAMPIRVILFG